jgi:hypothetical protein
MKASFLFYWPAWLGALFIFLLVLFFIWLGGQFRRFESKKGNKALTKELGSLENSMLGLLGLLLAFTFGISLEKFSERRRAIVEEANAIETAILRADLYPDSSRAVLRRDLQQYLESRIAYYEAGVDNEKIRMAMDTAEYYSNRIWKFIIHLSHDLDNRVRTMQMVPAVNAVIDIVATREELRQAKVPPLILMVLLFMIVLGSFLVGYDPKEKNRILIFIFALIGSLTLYLIIELDHPRRGLINLESAEKAMLDLRNLFRHE